MNGSEYMMLVGQARAFAQTVWLIESEIQRLGASPEHNRPIVGGTKGWPSRAVWESLKTASHFNLGVSFELRFKCLLELKARKRLSGKDGHMLAKLYRRMPPEIARRLAELFEESTRNCAITLRTFMYSPMAPEAPTSQPNTLQEFCEYMDQEMALWEKRYSWESASAPTWRHYIDDLGPFLDYLDKVEMLGRQVAREEGLIG